MNLRQINSLEPNRQRYRGLELRLLVVVVVVLVVLVLVVLPSSAGREQILSVGHRWVQQVLPPVLLVLLRPIQCLQGWEPLVNILLQDRSGNKPQTEPQ